MLHGFDQDRAASRHVDRLFLGLKPPPAIVEELADLRDLFGANGTVVRNEHLHLTLFLFEDRIGIAPEFLPALTATLDGFRSGRFRILLDQLSIKRNIVVRPSGPLPPLLAFQRELAELTARAGFPKMHDQPFSPHVSLCRGCQAMELRPSVLPMSWIVEEFALIHSFVGLTRHETLASWALV